MTATQVFLRFIKSEYTNSDGTIDMRKYNLWKKEIRCNYISSIYESRRGKIIIRPRSKKFVDDYLALNGYTLYGFAGHFFYNSSSLLSHIYGWQYKTSRDKFIGKWHEFVCKHIDGKIKSRHSGEKRYTFSWKE